MKFLLDANMPFSAKEIFPVEAEKIKRVLKNFVLNVDFKIVPKSVIIVEEDRYRIRK